MPVVLYCTRDTLYVELYLALLSVVLVSCTWLCALCIEGCVLGRLAVRCGGGLYTSRRALARVHKRHANTAKAAVHHLSLYASWPFYACFLVLFSTSSQLSDTGVRER